MSLTFFLMLLLVIGIVLANIALLRFSNKPMTVPKKDPTPADTAAASGKTQAATTGAIPIVASASTEQQKTVAEPGKVSPADSSESQAGGD